MDEAGQESEMADILGHRSTSLTGDYTHASAEEMVQAMERVASYTVPVFQSLANQGAAINA